MTIPMTAAIVDIVVGLLVVIVILYYLVRKKEGSSLGEARAGTEAIRPRMKKDWVVVGIIELVGGLLAVLVGFAVLRPGGAGSILEGLGFLIALIGSVVLINGLRAGDRKKGSCVICGRSIEFGRMYCHRCSPK